jgi:transposase
MATAYLGVDIAKATFQATLLVDGKKHRRSFHNRTSDFEALSKWLAKHQVVQGHVCMEATGTFWEEVAEFLHQAGHHVSVVNPARIRDYARSKMIRNKTDKLDADIIVDFCQTQSPPAWTPLPPELRELRLLVRHLEDLQQMRTQEANRLSSGSLSVQVRQMIENHLAFLDEQIKTLEQRIEEHIDQHPDLREKRDLLVSIKGIGPITAARLLSENIQSFTQTRALVAYAGLNPQLRESGTSIHGRPRLSKIGNSNLRKALYFPAISAMRFNPVVREFCDRLDKRNKPKMVIIGAAMRKLLCLALGVLKSGVPFDQDYALLRASGT